MTGPFNSFNNYPEIVRRIKPAAQIVVQKATKEIVKTAQANAAVDTGLMKKSIYRTGGGMNSSYGKINPEAKLGKNKAGVSTKRHIKNYVKKRAKQRKQEALLFNELPAPPEKTEAYVAVAATYGGFVNYGTHKMAAQPFWEPALAAGQEYLAFAQKDFNPVLEGGATGTIMGEISSL